MTVILYSKEGCSNCDATKQLLTSNDVSFQEYIVGKDISREDVLKQFPDAKFVPIIMINGHRVAGVAELSDMINRGQLQLLLEG
jgi:glutaredoxin